MKIAKDTLINASHKVKGEYPRISIITPSYNQGQYIEETILSVINQNYPNLEYIIMDGGSTDQTLEVIKKYDKYIDYWVSEPDQGQADAINKGFKIASGDILGWINSDDYYVDGALEKIAKAIDSDREVFFYGNANYHFEESNRFSHVNVIEKIKRYHLPFDLGFIQPATFWTKSLWDDVGPLNTLYTYGFDWEWFLRVCKVTLPTPIDSTLATYRVHSTHKSGTGGKARSNELLEILENYGFSDYAKSIKQMDIRIVRYVVSLSAKYRIGAILYSVIGVLNRKYWKYSAKELGELFVKAKGIYG